MKLTWILISVCAYLALLLPPVSTHLRIPPRLNIFESDASQYSVEQYIYFRAVSILSTAYIRTSSVSQDKVSSSLLRTFSLAKRMQSASSLSMACSLSLQATSFA